MTSSAWRCAAAVAYGKLFRLQFVSILLKTLITRVKMSIGETPPSTDRCDSESTVIAVTPKHPGCTFLGQTAQETESYPGGGSGAPLMTNIQVSAKPMSLSRRLPNGCLINAHMVS